MGVHLENYDDDGAYIHLAYSTKIYTDDGNDKSKDMANKRTKRALQKQQKANVKAKKSSKIKSYA